MFEQEKLHVAEAYEKATACFGEFDLVPEMVLVAQPEQIEFHLVREHKLFG